MKSHAIGSPIKTRGITRGGYLILGLLCVALGFIGLIVPGMPGTVFFIIALWAFQRSSSRLERWLLSNRLIGPTLRNWHETRSLTLRTKIVAITAIWLCIATSMTLTHKVWLEIVLAVTGGCLTYYLASRPTKS